MSNEKAIEESKMQQDDMQHGKNGSHIALQIDAIMLMLMACIGMK